MYNYKDAIKNLNPEQRRAVETTEGPIMVVAGPGTGKTQILALRIAYILDSSDVGAENILCLTFTEAGVKAMRERLFSFIGKDAYLVSIYTFHGFANEIIRSNLSKFAFSKELTQLDDVSKIKLFKSLIDNTKELDKIIPFYNKYSKINEIIQAIQTLKKENISPDGLIVKLKNLIDSHELSININKKTNKPTIKWQQKQDKLIQLKELSIIYKKYEENLAQNGFYDYEDMIQNVIKVFKSDVDFLSNFQESYQYILVDEFQDTNGSQNAIIELLTNFVYSKDLPNIFVVGDDDQAIYRFQGASLENILGFTTKYPKNEIIVTPTNYRSTQIILDIADSLIKNNQTRLVNNIDGLTKRLISFKSQLNSNNDQKAEIWELNNQDEENIFISKKINELHETGVNYSDIAVLYRKNKHAEEISNSLNKFNIPTKLDVTSNIFEQPIVNQLINLLKLINLENISDDLIYTVLISDILNIPTVEVYRFNDYCRSKKLNLKDTLIKFSENNNSSEDELINFPNIKKFTDILFSLHKTALNTSLVVFTERLLLEFNIFKIILKKDNDNSNDIGEGNGNFTDLLTITTFYNWIKMQEAINTGIKLSQLLKNFELIKENNIKISLPKSETTEDAVNLLTAHSSKGLEFKYVFIVKCTENNWGKNRATPTLLIPEIHTAEGIEIDENNLRLEDERRLFFVAVTRAKDKLYFTYANEYSENGIITKASPTIFLNEINAELKTKKSVNLNDIEFNENDYVKLLTPVTKKTYSEEEKNYLIKKVQNFKLSPSALNTYLESPALFKEQYLLRIPQSKTKELALGTSVHFALENLNLAIINKEIEKPSQISLDKLIFDFNKKLTIEFTGYEDYERTQKEGNILLTKYYNEYIRTDIYIPPILAEYTFNSNRIFIEDGKSEPIILTGKIDKVELLDIETKRVRIIDYKTSKPKSDNDIKGLTKSSNGSIWRQLVFYKLLSERDSKFKFNVDEVQIDFIKNEKNKFTKRTFKITENDVNELKNTIFEVVNKIKRLIFE